MYKKTREWKKNRAPEKKIAMKKTSVVMLKISIASYENPNKCTKNKDRVRVVASHK